MQIIASETISAAKSNTYFLDILAELTTNEVVYGWDKYEGIYDEFKLNYVTVRQTFLGVSENLNGLNLIMTTAWDRSGVTDATTTPYGYESVKDQTIIIG